MIVRTYIKMHSGGFPVKVYKILIVDPSDAIPSRTRYFIQYPTGGLEQITTAEFTQMKNPE